MSTRFGKYELQALLGKGGMAEVFRAEAIEGEHKGRTMALKRLMPRFAENPTYLDLFLGEADLTRQLNHPGIVEVWDTGVVGNYYYIAMQYVEGTDLGHLMSRCGGRSRQIPIDVCCHAAAQIANALAYAHNAKSMTGEPLQIVHRDVTPENIFVSDRGDVRLGDFGVAQANGIGDPLDDGRVAGKPEYLAPEQLLRTPLAGDTDVYALGIVLYELLTLEHPFKRKSGESDEDLYRRIVFGEFAAPTTHRANIPEALEQIVLRAIAPERSDGSLRARLKLKARIGRAPRFANAESFSAALREFYDPGGDAQERLSQLVRDLFGEAGATHRARRYDVNFPVSMETETTIASATTENLSRSGAFLTMFMPPDLGARARITLQTPQGRLPLLCEVVWRRIGQHPNGCGVRFMPRDEGEAKALRELIDMLSMRLERQLEAENVQDGDTEYESYDGEPTFVESPMIDLVKLLESTSATEGGDTGFTTDQTVEHRLPTEK